jgi:hypothetical protein
MNVNTQALTILRGLLNKAGDLSQLSPSASVEKLWTIYKTDHESNNNLNGAVFEEILGYVLTKEGCVPFYMQARVAYVPNVNYDFILYDADEGPISLSAKTSLRERWKQADLEAVALKYVHRNALSYAITMDKTEAATRTAKLKDCMALNDFILADSEKFDQLIADIKSRNLVKAGSIEIVTSNTIIDSDNSASRYGI